MIVHPIGMMRANAASGLNFVDDYTTGHADGFILTTDDPTNWSNIAGANRFTVNSGAVSIGAGGYKTQTIGFVGATVPDDMYFETTLSNAGLLAEGANSNLDVYLRYVDADNWCQLQIYSGQIWNVNKKIGGTTSYGIYGGPGPRDATSNGDIIRIELSGSNITVKLNGTTLRTPVSDAGVGALTGGSVHIVGINLPGLASPELKLANIKIGSL